jgi:hypothetical protein
MRALVPLGGPAAGWRAAQGRRGSLPSIPSTRSHGPAGRQRLVGAVHLLQPRRAGRSVEAHLVEGEADGGVVRHAREPVACVFVSRHDEGLAVRTD